MTIWQPSLEGRTGPRYIAIADALANDLAAGRFAAGERLPTHRDLAWRLGVTVGTVSRAYAEAGRRGLVSGEVGRGTFVRAALPLEAQVMTVAPDAGPGFIDLNFNFPPSGGEEQALRATLNAIAAAPDSAALLAYQSHAGLPAHRAAASQWLARYGLEAPAERIAITAGAQHAILVTFAALTRPGDRILTEALTYPGVQLAARMLGLRLDGLPLDGEGLLPEAFEAACRNNDVKALYCIPTLHNPTTVTLPETRRRAIAEIATRHGVAIVEDDIFRLMAPKAPPPISSFAPERGYFITSLSKTTAPGLRVGFIAAPEGSFDRIASALRTVCWMATPLTAEIAARWIRDGTAARILEARRAEMSARRGQVLDTLQGHRVDCPDGSLHFWLHLPEPWRSADFAAEAKRRGVGVTPAEAFAVGRSNLTHAVRLCHGAPASRAILDQALAAVQDLLSETPPEPFGSLV
ncbi:MAG: PLP-dependent aminotransferase family protein [Alphaproteobacteria bacterium]|nr:PLP-dependent aminotransferase family protein [Alphaproteobacteria bacterium]